MVELSLSHPLQALLIADEYKEDVITGKKKISIREGMRNYIAGKPFMICDEKTSFCVKADLKKVRHCIADDVTEEEYRADNYASREEMTTDLKRFYPNFTDKSFVTVLSWDNVSGYLVDLRAKK